MYKLLKFYPAGFNLQRSRTERYASLAGRSAAEYRRQDFWPLLEKNLEKNRRYLDAGCGLGGWIIFLNEQGYQIEGTDKIARSVRSLTEYNPALKVKIASLNALPYPDEYFGGVLSIGALEFMEDKVAAALREVHRVLEPNGLFFIEVPYANILRRLFYLPLKQLEKAIKKKRGLTPAFSNYLFHPSELKKMLADAGFQTTAVQPHDLPQANSHFGLFIDWKILRGHQPYQLNLLGLIVKKILNTISPWFAATGIVIVARKK